MNFGHVLFSPNGRIGQQDYWIGILIIVVGNFIGWMLPILLIITLPLFIWIGIAVYGKRLHDAGKTAWYHALVWALGFVLFIVGLAVVIATAISAGIISENSDLSLQEVFAALSIGGLGVLLMGASQLVWLIYTVWVGVMKGDPGENRFGPVPGGDAGTAANIAAASASAGAPLAGEGRAHTPPAVKPEDTPAPDDAPNS